MKISATCEVPDAAMRQHVGILGTTGSGKSFVARKMIEEVEPSAPRIAIIDPKGDWYGLRLAADGKGKGLDFTIIGGPHADPGLRIDPENPGHLAKPLGMMIATTECRVILDLSDLAVTAMRRFVAELLKEIYHHNRRPLILVVDEADEFAPQKPSGDATHALSAMERIAKRGRQRGVRLWPISQRPASINKDVLGMMQTLVVMKMNLPHDKEAIREWIKDQPGAGKGGEELVKSLPQLHREGWLWFPQGELLTRFKADPIKTFDSMRTPDETDEVIDVKLPPLKTDAVQAALKAVGEDTNASTPSALKAEVLRLKKQLADALATPVTVTPDTDLVATLNERLTDTQAALEVADGNYLELAGMLRNELDGIEFRVKNIRDRLGVIDHRRETFGHPGDTEGADSDTKPPRIDTPAAEPRVHRPASGGGGRGIAGRAQTSPPAAGELNGPQIRILNACAWWAKIGVETPTRLQVGFVARLKPTGGHFTNNLGPLVTAGYLASQNDGTVYLTAKGKGAASWPDSKPTLAAYHDGIRDVLKTGAQIRILNAVIQLGRAGSTTAERLGMAAGLGHTGGHFSNNVGPLSTLGLIDRSNGTVRGTKLLFPEGLK